ncbi:MAG: TSUP family transporter [Acidobacteriota bacterium]
MRARTLLFLTLGAIALVYLGRWIWSIRSGRESGDQAVGTSPLQAGIGFVTNFFDTLGIGSFAPTTALFKLWQVVPDERIPGTLHVGDTPPVIVQAFIFIAIIEVDMKTLATLIGASVLGAWLGAGVVSRWPRRRIQIGMGIALLIAAATFVMANFGIVPVGGARLGLDGTSLAVGMAGNFILGALMTIGIGMYAPSMIMISVLGMNPTTAFPIMMGSSAFLMPVASIRFLAANAYSLRPALGLALGGLPAVIIAAFLVKSLSLVTVRWLVVVVVLYSALAMLRSAYVER